jgi:dienelactone hydrolase
VNVAFLLLLALPGTEPLNFDGDPALAMVDGIKQYLMKLTAAPPRPVDSSRERLRYVLGVVDERVAFDAPEVISGTTIRWPVLDGVWAEGVLLKPKGKPRGFVVAVPDADESPEHFVAARRFAAEGLMVLSPTLIDRGMHPAVKYTRREWIYRMAYPLGRHVIGFEVQKILAGIDWFAKQAAGRPISVYGYGEGGMLALFAGALDERINSVTVSGFTLDRQGTWHEPIYRNVWGIARDFGDLTALIKPRKLIVDSRRGPAVASLPEPAAPGSLEGETSRPQDDPARQRRMVLEIERFLLRLVPQLEKKRTADREKLRDELIGELPEDNTPLRPRTRELENGGYEVMLDIAPDVIAYGVLLLPKDMKPGERRPTVVMQHGLNGRPQSLYGQTSGRDLEVYGNVGQRLADEGFVVYMPQNPYIHDFRPISRLANPLGLTLFSVIQRQHSRMLDWLSAQPFVDAKRIGFYGLSYGGKTALRVPPLEDRYALSICSGDFNEWVRKLIDPAERYSYMLTKEYEILEFNLAGIASHAEMATMIAPRPFMVERGHRDGVGIDEWVGYEYAKVKRFYDEAGIGDRTEIAWFNGPHRIDGRATIAFLKKYLGK